MGLTCKDGAGELGGIVSSGREEGDNVRRSEGLGLGLGLGVGCGTGFGAAFRVGLLVGFGVVFRVGLSVVFRIGFRIGLRVGFGVGFGLVRTGFEVLYFFLPTAFFLLLLRFNEGLGVTYLRDRWGALVNRRSRPDLDSFELLPTFGRRR